MTTKSLKRKRPLFFVYKVYSYSYSNDILNDIARNADLDTIYNTTYKRYRLDVFVVHCFGIVFYVVSTILVPRLLVAVYPTLFSHADRFVQHMAMIGFLLGTVWNVTGMFRNQRIIWYDVLPQMKTPSIQKRVSRSNFRFFAYNAIGNLISFAVLCILAIIIVFNIHPEIIKVDTFKRILTEYSFVIISFAALVAYYAKVGFRFLYSSHNNGVSVFPSIETILCPFAEVKKSA